MNIENIQSLVDMLARVGLDEGIGKKLLQAACFQPREFTLVKQVKKAKDRLSCSFCFVLKKEAYVCNYYDVSLLKNIWLPDHVIDAVNLKELDEKMSDIQWEDQSEDGNDFDLHNEGTWKRESEIEQVIKLLRKLGSGEGKYFADALKVKHWSCSNNPLLGNLHGIRARFEISQRFYFVDGEAISIDEAYRFLLNRWFEKQQILSRKQAAGAGGGEDGNPGAEPGVATGLSKTNKNNKRKLKS